MAWQTVEQENWPTALDIWERISLSMKTMVGSTAAEIDDEASSSSEQSSM